MNHPSTRLKPKTAKTVPPRGREIQSKRAKTITVLLVDHHEISRAGERAVLNQIDAMEVVGEAATIAEAVEAARRLKPNVAMVELRMPDGSAVEACRRIREVSSNTYLLVVTNRADDESIIAALRAGATGFVLKTIAGEDLVRTVETVAKGQSILDSTVTQRIMTHLCSLSVTTCGKPEGKLSAQEKRVMDLVIQGKTNKEIGCVLGLSDPTVKNYLNHIYRKLQVTRRAQATSSFIQQMRDTCDLSEADLTCPLFPPPSV